MKLNIPLPQPLPKECEKAAKIFKSFVDNANNGLDGVIPRSILENAKGFAIFTIVKAGFVVSARAGSGVVIAKLDDGTWSAPSAIGTAGLGLGGQAGAEMTDFLIVLNSRSAIRSFMAAGSLTLGGNMSLALGPLGRHGEASGALNTNGKVAAMYSYSKTRGLFGGVSVEGSVIVERQDANFQAYNSPVTARLLLGGTVESPQWAVPLIKTLEACTGMPGNREWINEDVRKSTDNTYAFGGLASPGSVNVTPSFLRKKKKPEAPPFPPASWDTENDEGSYFSNPASRSHSRTITWDGDDSHWPKNGGHTQFDSDIAPAKMTSPFGSSSMGVTPRSQSDTNPFSGSRLSSDTARSRTAGIFSHYRAKSLRYDSYVPPTNNVDDPSLSSPSLAQNSSTPPFIKPRIELSKPLLSHEGVARAIALYDFNAIENGDLSFRKGDVIVISKKSESIDDWWTGKLNGHQGIFPANFVEIA